MARGMRTRQPSRSGRQEGVSARRPRGLPAELVGGAGRSPEVQGRAQPASFPGRAPAKLPPAKPESRRPPAPAYDLLAPDRVAEILKRLDQLYPGVTCALEHQSAWHLLVATILSAQCTDQRVNMVTPVLFSKYPSVRHFAALKPEELEPDIRSTGFFRNKSKSIVGAAQRVVKEYGGQVPDDMERLLTLPGVARKTANVVLGTWFKKAVGVVVDTHVHRISRRLELTKQDDPGKIEQDLMRVIPQEKWIDFAHQVIWHGRKLCTARNPRCADCPLEPLCHAADKTWSTVEKHKTAR
jgi:endonuclease-3